MNLAEYKVLLGKHDWLYQFSEDRTVIQNGERSHAVIRLAASLSLEHKRAYNECYAKHFHRAPWNPPYSFPYPEAQAHVE